MPRRKQEGPPGIRVRVLGATEITVGARRVGMNTEMLFALALYLTTRAGERISREELLDVFWDSGSEEDRRHALRQLMYRLRQKGFEMDEDGEQLWLDPKRVDSDLREVLEEGWWERATEAQIDGAARWGPRLRLPRSDGFNRWIETTRELAAASHRRGSLRALSLARQGGRWTEVDRWARSVLLSDELNEEATLARAESAAMSGSRSIALEIIDTFVRELGENDDLCKPARILRKRIAEKRTAWNSRGAKEVPLVGRSALLETTIGLVLQSSSAEGASIWVSGAPGIGKSRLAHEALTLAELRGLRTVAVACEGTAVERPLGIVQRLVASLLEIPSSAGCHPSSRDLLMQLVKRVPVLSRHDVSTMIGSIGPQIPHALTDMVEAVGESSRLLIVLDDLHNADASSLHVLGAASRASRGARVCWLFLSRTNPQSNAWPDAPGVGALHRLKVTPLSMRESATLASDTCSAHGIVLSSSHAERIADVAGGNPLFVRELASSHKRGSDRKELAATLSRAIRERLEGMAEDTLRLLAAVALLEDVATLPHLESALGQPMAQLSSALRAMEDDGVISMSDAGVLHLHDCWRQEVLEKFPKTSRALLRKCCADAISRPLGHGATPEMSWKSAQLYRDSGFHDDAFRHYLSAADGLYAAALPHEAITVLRIAQTLARSLDQSVALRARITSSLLVQGKHGEAISEANDAYSPTRLSECENRDDAAALVHARFEALLRGSTVDSEDVAVLLHFAQDLRVGTRFRQHCSLLGVAWAANAADWSLLQQFYQSASTLSKNEFHSLAGRLAQLVFAAETTQIQQTQHVISQIDAGSWPDESLSLRARGARYVASALRRVGRYAEASERLEQSYTLCMGANLKADAAIAAETVTFMRLDDNAISDARMWVELCEACTVDHSSFERVSAVAHCRDRIALQSGDSDSVVSRMRTRLPGVRNDWSTRRRCGELSTFAWALAMHGDHQAARELVREVIPMLESSLGNFAIDYSVEALLRTGDLAGDVERISQLSDAHLAEMTRMSKRLPPPFCEQLLARRPAR